MRAAAFGTIRASIPPRHRLAFHGHPMTSVPHRSISMARLAAACVLATALGGCAVVSVAGSAAGAAISVTGAVVSAGVKVTGKVVEKAIDVAVPGSGSSD